MYAELKKYQWAGSSKMRCIELALPIISYILPLTWEIGPFPPQLKCPLVGPVNSEVGVINSKRILNGFWGIPAEGGGGVGWGGGMGSSMNSQGAFTSTPMGVFVDFPETDSEECSRHGMER